MTKNQIRNLEIEARTLVLKRLEQPIKLLKAQTQKDLAERKARLDKLSQFSSLEEARELWGYNAITQKEFEEAEHFFTEKEEQLDEKLPSELALEVIAAFYDRISWEKRVFEENDGIDENE